MALGIARAIRHRNDVESSAHAFDFFVQTYSRLKPLTSVQTSTAVPLSRTFGRIGIPKTPLIPAGANSSVQPVTRPVGGFHDILIGANGAYAALPGYDYITGLGSLDVGVTSQKL